MLLIGDDQWGTRGNLTPLQLETRFWGQDYLDLV